MPRGRALVLLCLVALAHAAAYIAYQRPDWATAWTDQAGYRRLGEVLATTGRFTRYPDAPAFVPEVIRTPGYPAFVAAVYLVAGVGNDMAVAAAQAVVFAGLVLLVFAVTQRACAGSGRGGTEVPPYDSSDIPPSSDVGGTEVPPYGSSDIAPRGSVGTEVPPYTGNGRAPIVAAGMAALYAPFPYFGALVVTELWATFVLTGAMALCLRAVRGGSLAAYAAAGVGFGAATLVRPAFVLLPFFLAAAVPIVARGERTRRALAGWAVLALASALTLTPWFAYNYVNLGQMTLSPAGGVGRGLWEGSWQGRWPGRLQARLTSLAETSASRDALDAAVADVAAEAGLAAEPMLRYVHEWRDLHELWDTPTDPAERARARVVADAEYQRAALAHIREDPAGHLWRRLTTGAFVLWAAETPIRHSQVNDVPTLVIRVIWAVQVALLVVAGLGAMRLAQAGRWIECVLLVLPLVYVSAVHLPLLCEARQSLPVKPLVLALAAIGIATSERRN